MKKQIRVKDNRRTLLFDPLPVPSKSGVAAKLAGYIRAGKKFVYAVSFVALCAGLLTAPLTLTGCGTPAAKTTQAAGTVAISVDAAMNAWGDWVRAGRATVPQRVKVRDAYAKYQGSMRVAEVVAVDVIGAPDNQTRYAAALQAVSASSADLLSLIESFTK